MSAAVWAEPYDPHQRLRPIRVDGTVPAPRASRVNVRLAVWGETDNDRKYAEAHARVDPRLSRYRIVEVEQAEQPTTSPKDPRAIAHHAEYGRTWAAYPLDSAQAAVETVE